MDALSAAPLRAVVFREVIGLNEERCDAVPEGLISELGVVVDSTTPTATTRRPVSLGSQPARPYSVRGPLTPSS